MPVLIESSVRAALIAVAVAAVAQGLRLANPRARHMAWSAVLYAMLLLPAFCLWGPKATLGILPRVGDAATRVASAPIDFSPAESSSAATPLRPGPRATGVVPRPVSARPDWLSMAYLLVAGVLLIRFVHGAIRAAFIRKHAQPEQGFFSSPECASPITIGFWRPVIMLPVAWTEWPEAELDAVLVHERGHVRRRDPLVQWLAALNRCIFWFHPLAWWLEHRLSALAEECCDAAVIAAGHDPQNYSEYLIHQARAVERAGARIALSSPAIGRGSLSQRIRRLLDAPPATELTRSRAILGTALCIFAIASLATCRVDHVEGPAAGQPTMHDLAQRSADSNRQYQDREKAIVDRAHTLTDAEAPQLFARLKEHPQDIDTYWTLVRHYEFKVNIKDLDALRLWYIEHQPAGRVSGGNINPRIDRAGYEKGKALWLAHLKKPAASADMYQRAADFLEGGDKPLAESALVAGRNAYPDDKRWAMAFGRHYAQVLAGSAEPPTEFNVIRTLSAQEAQSAYAQTVRARLAESRDARVLTQTAQWLLAFSNPFRRGASKTASESLELARAYVDRALLIEPELDGALRVKMHLTAVEESIRIQRLMKMPPSELASAPLHDRMLFTMHQMRNASVGQNFAGAALKAKDLLELAAQNRNNVLNGEVIFEANMVMGKAALRRGDRKTSARYLLAAAEAPDSYRISRGDFEMNLPRALVDRGERRAVIEFFRRMAPKTKRAKQFQEWADELSKGLNPDLLPTLSAPGCTNDPC